MFICVGVCGCVYVVCGDGGDGSCGGVVCCSGGGCCGGCSVGACCVGGIGGGGLVVVVVVAVLQEVQILSTLPVVALVVEVVVKMGVLC